MESISKIRFCNEKILTKTKNVGGIEPFDFNNYLKHPLYVVIAGAYGWDAPFTQ
jgi:hypothetical protein